MPRRPRVFVEGWIYYVFNRFARGADLFSEPEEAIAFLEILRKARDRDGWTILAWCLMSNHYHLALRAGAIPLSRTLGYVQARFGQGYNTRHGSSGPRWQSHYKARLVEESGYLDHLIVYIHLNPVMAGLVDDPADYSFSGHRELLGKVRAPLIGVESVLASCGDTLRSSRRADVRGLKGAREAEWKGEQPGGLPWWGRRADRPLEPVEPGAWIDELGRSTGLERQQMGAGEFLEAGCRLFGSTTEEFAAPGKKRSISLLRYLITALAIERWGIRAKAIAELVGRRPEAVSRWASPGGGFEAAITRIRCGVRGAGQGSCRRAKAKAR